MNRNIRLRALEPEDTDFVMECEADSEAAKWSDYTAPLSRNQILNYALTYDADPFAAGQLRLILEKEDGMPAGIIDLYNISAKDGKAYVGITIHPDLRRKGYAAEGLKETFAFCNDRLGLKNLVAKISTKNMGATRLFEQAGYKKIAFLPSWHKLGNEFHDFNLFTSAL